MANGPYRRAYQRRPTCAIHAEASAEARCDRCSAGMCGGCAMPSGARVVCPGCTRIFGRHGLAGRVLAAVVVTLVAVAPALASLDPQRDKRVGTNYIVDVAVRSCDTSSVDLVIGSLIMNSREREAVAAADAFTAVCDPSDAMRGMIDRARARLAHP